jgi:uncharacterized RDD family membrane protein YckC
VLVDDRMTIATPEGVEVEMVLAGLGSRFLARLLDSLIQAVCIIALGIAAAVTGQTGVGDWALLFWVVGVFVVVWVYDVAFETLASGRTPGKRAAGIRVVGMRGEAIGFRASAVRNVLRIIDLVLLYFPAVLSILLTRRNQRLGDLAAGTVVVREAFGGRRGDDTVSSWSQVTVAPAAVATWDVSALTTDDVLTVRRFLDRRLALPWHIRTYLGTELVQRIAPRVTGVPDNVHPEYLLEGVVVAKQARA